MTKLNVTDGASHGDSGYTNCKCRDCFELTVSDNVNEPEFCSGCDEVGCSGYRGVRGMSQECQRDDSEDESHDDYGDSLAHL